jgi:hypothetical protein
MAGAFTIKKGNRAIPITGTLRNGDGTVVNLTSCTVKFVMTPIDVLTPPKVNASATIVSAPAGTVSYTFAAADVDTVGMFDVEWQVTFPSTYVGTFPGDDYDRVVIEAALA